MRCIVSVTNEDGEVLVRFGVDVPITGDQPPPVMLARAVIRTLASDIEAGAEDSF